MKKAILILALAVTGIVNAQLEVTTKKTDSTIYDRLGLSVVEFYEGSDTSFVIYYRNAKYTHITDVQYLTIGSRENLRQLLDLSIDVMDNNTEYKTSLYILDRATKKAARVWTDRGYFYLQRKDKENIKL